MVAGYAVCCLWEDFKESNVAVDKKKARFLSGFGSIVFYFFCTVDFRSHPCRAT